jgi:hypothetical protein
VEHEKERMKIPILGAIVRTLTGRGRLRTTTLMLIGIAVLAIGGGAAAGTAMRGDVDAKIPVTVSQALVAEKPIPYNFPPGRKFFGSVSDDQTKFSIALEMFRGDTLTVLVPIINRSTGDTVADFSIVMPEVPTLIAGMQGLTVEVAGSGVIDDVVVVSGDSWTFTVDSSADGLNATPDDGLLLTVSVAQTAMSGQYVITGRVRTIEF